MLNMGRLSVTVRLIVEATSMTKKNIYIEGNSLRSSGKPAYPL